MTSNEGAQRSITGDPKRDEMISALREIIRDRGDEAWNVAWQKKITPWDSGDVQPPLKDLATSPLGKTIIDDIFCADEATHTTPRALVPGCGKGYDAAFLASLGLKTWGIDLSPLAIEAASSWVATVPEFNKEDSTLAKNVSYHALDFFKFEVPSEKFSLIYDYTFFCAIPPELREPWGARMSEILRPGGYLITLVYPIDGPRTGGPPYSLTVELVEEMLTKSDKNAWEKVLDEVPLSHSEGHHGRERMVVWKRLNSSAKL
ncbi:hypothetical protein FRC03_003912 [Tulasnella sp. 419]|nr:hypothetical protein FRC03_003912 [Tulasnella sp. 419]